MIDIVSITDLKQNTKKVISQVKQKGSIWILARSKPTAVLVDPQYFATLESAIEDHIDTQTIEMRKSEKEIPLEKVANKLGIK